jgi:hypothetical protein
MAKKKKSSGSAATAPVTVASPGFNVFLMWSGAMSKAVAGTLRLWLPKVHQYVKPWMSETDIDRGAVWEAELLTQLSTQRFGIACLTPEIPGGSYWMLFEAGALWRSAPGDSRICTYLLDLRPNDVHQPLQKFQNSIADEGNTFAMIKSLNKALGMPLDEPALLDSFRVRWPELEEALKNIPRGTASRPIARPTPEILEEILTASRNQDRTLQGLVKWALNAEKTLADIKAAHPDLIASLNSPNWIESSLYTGFGGTGTPTPATKVFFTSMESNPFGYPETEKLKRTMGIRNDLADQATTAEAIAKAAEGMKKEASKRKEEAKKKGRHRPD